MKSFTWRKWKLGFVIAIGAALLSAGAGGLAGMSGWKPFVAVICMSLITHLSTYLKNHPIEDIDDPADAAPYKPSDPPVTIGGLQAMSKDQLEQIAKDKS
jgi:hypothetical protein